MNRMLLDPNMAEQFEQFALVGLYDSFSPGEPYAAVVLSKYQPKIEAGEWYIDLPSWYDLDRTLLIAVPYGVSPETLASNSIDALLRRMVGNDQAQQMITDSTTNTSIRC